MDQTGWLIPTILIGLVAFITTNIDTLLLLLLLFSQANIKKRHIVIGHFLGSIVIILVSILGFFGKFLVPLAWIGFLGVVPIILGIRGISELFRKQKPERQAEVALDKPLPPGRSSFARVVLEPLLNLETYRVTIMTIGNGSDNISTYAPLFASESFIRVIVLVSLFLLLIGIWCYLGYALSRFPAIVYTIEHYGSILLPFAFILLGFFILLQSGTFLLLAQLLKLR